MAAQTLDFDLDSLTEKLQNTTIPDTSSVSFAGKTLKLNSRDDAKEVVEAIDSCSSLHYINFEGNSMGVEAAEEVAKALTKHPELKNAIWKDMFTGRLKTEIPVALAALGKGVTDSGAELECLDLSDNASGPVGVNGFGHLLRSKACFTLKELRLNNMGLGITGAKMLAEALMDCLKNSRNAGKPLALKVFIAGRNRLENEGAMALAKVFKEMGTLEELSIPQNGICWQGIKAMAEALAHNKDLRKLVLNDNIVRKEGALALASVLPSLIKLIHLDLGDCLLRSSGALNLLKAFESAPLTNLQEVNLSYNEIQGSVGVQLANALAKKVSLNNVELNGNQFGPKGKENVISAFTLSKKEHILGSLSQNEDESEGEDEDKEKSEGEEEEEEEDDDDDEEEEEEEEEEGQEIDEEEDDDAEESEGEDEEEKRGKRMNENNFFSGLSPMNRPLTLKPKVNASEFLDDPSLENFKSLEGKKDQLILAEVKSDIEKLMQAISLVSTLYTIEKDTEVLRVSEELFKELFKDHSESSLSTINNSLPVHLGLIKSEEKNKGKKRINKEGCIIAVQNAIDKGIMPDFTRTILEMLIKNTHQIR